jgi:RNA polymerase sigma-70 factor (ECF subfamily)
MMSTAVTTQASADALFVRSLDQAASQHMGIAFRILGNTEDAHEVLQEAWLRAWRHRSQVRDDAAFDAWLRRIVVRECYRRLRWRKTRSWLTLGAIPERADPAPSPEHSTEHSRRRARLHAATSTLSPRQHLVFGLRFEQGWSVREIATATELEPDTVKTHLKRALAKVRKRMEATDGL